MIEFFRGMPWIDILTCFMALAVTIAAIFSMVWVYAADIYEGRTKYGAKSKSKK